MGTTGNSSAKFGTPVTFTCVCCAKTLHSTPLTYVHENGHKFLVCKSCYWRLDHLAKFPRQYRTAMRFLGTLDGVA